MSRSHDFRTGGKQDKINQSNVLKADTWVVSDHVLPVYKYQASLSSAQNFVIFQVGRVFASTVFERNSSAFLERNLWLLPLKSLEIALKMSARCRQNYHATSEAEVNKQINLELYASYVYLSMVRKIIDFKSFEIRPIH
jgi:ferritin heavy chain